MVLHTEFSSSSDHRNTHRRSFPHSPDCQQFDESTTTPSISPGACAWLYDTDGKERGRQSERETTKNNYLTPTASVAEAESLLYTSSEEHCHRLFTHRTARVSATLYLIHESASSSWLLSGSQRGCTYGRRPGEWPAHRRALCEHLRAQYLDQGYLGYEDVLVVGEGASTGSQPPPTCYFIILFRMLHYWVFIYTTPGDLRCYAKLSMNVTFKRFSPTGQQMVVLSHVTLH